METIADAYENNARVRATLRSVLEGMSLEQLTSRPDGEKWSIQEIVEHIAMVDEGSSRICAKLVGEAKGSGRPGDGKIGLTAEFGEKSRAIAGMKVEAPERVQPTGKVEIADALSKMEETKKTFDALRPDLEAFDLSDHKFPHPFFGPLTAAEWLVLAGGHEARHVKQIQELKKKLQ